MSRPLIYSCSGCSGAAQTSNQVAVELDREGLVEMSCIAGVGGDVKPLVKKAQSGRDIIIVDGCQLACCKKSLERIGVSPAYSINLAEEGIKKSHQSKDDGDVPLIKALVTQHLQS